MAKIVICEGGFICIICMSKESGSDWVACGWG